MELKSSHRIVSDERYEELKNRLKELLMREDIKKAAPDIEYQEQLSKENQSRNSD